MRVCVCVGSSSFSSNDSHQIVVSSGLLTIQNHNIDLLFFVLTFIAQQQLAEQVSCNQMYVYVPGI